MSLLAAQCRSLDTMQSSGFYVHVIIRPPTHTTALQTSQSMAHCQFPQGHAFLLGRDADNHSSLVGFGCNAHTQMGQQCAFPLKASLKFLPTDR